MKTSKKHFEIFQKECRKWIKVFGLFGWRFYFGHYHALDGCIAWCEKPNELSDRVFTLGLEPEIDSKVPISIQDIKRAAFHEVMEAFLWRMESIARSRVGFESDIREERHNIIRTLEAVIFENGKG